jgi:SAM-dependent methyltransferase
MHAELKRQLLDTACAPYRAAGSFHYHWALGKLGHDPVFSSLLEQGTLKQSKRVLDLGCGRGLLAAWFLAADRLRSSGQWPVSFEVPTGVEFHGIDLHEGACQVGNQALQAQFGKQVSLVCGDMCRANLQGYDAITLLDVLHYVSYSQQDLLLDQIRAALGPGGLLLIRVGNPQGGWRFRWSQWVDLAVAQGQGHRIRTLYCRSLPDWTRALEVRGFTVSAQSMSQGTPFANALLKACLPAVK